MPYGSAIIFSGEQTQPLPPARGSIGETVGIPHSTRVAILHYSAPPIVGGVEKVIRDQAEGLLAAGLTVKVVAARGAQWNPGIPFARVPEMDSLFEPALEHQKGLIHGHSTLDQFEELAIRLRDALEGAISDCDVAIVHNVMTMHKNLALVRAIRLLAKAERAPRLIIWTHDIAVLDHLYKDQIGRGYPWNLLWEPLEGATYVAVSHSRRQQLSAVTGLDAARIEVIPNGVDVAEVLQISEETLELLRQWELYGRRPLILMPTRITRRKRIELAIKAVHLLVPRFPDMALVVTGPPGPHNPASVSYAQELAELRFRLGLDRHVFFLQAEGRQNRCSPLPVGTVYELMRWADAVLITSSHEGFGLPAVEAALLRTPLVTVGLDPIRSTVGPYATYIRSSEHPDEAVASALLEVLESPQCTVRQYLMGTFDRYAVISNKVLPLLERVLAEKV